MRKIKEDLNKWNNVLVNLVLILQRFWFSQNWGIIKLSPWNSQYVFGNWQAYFKFYINMQGIMSSSPEFLSQNSVRLTFNALKLPFHEHLSLVLSLLLPRKIKEYHPSLKPSNWDYMDFLEYNIFFLGLECQPLLDPGISVLLDITSLISFLNNDMLTQTRVQEDL